MNDSALNQARDESRELEEAEAQLDKDSRRQNFWGALLIVTLVMSCIGFIVGALWVADTIGLQFRVYMDGTLNEEDQPFRD